MTEVCVVAAELVGGLLPEHYQFAPAPRKRKKKDQTEEVVLLSIL